MRGAAELGGWAVGVSEPRELTVRRGWGLGPPGHVHFCPPLPVVWG